MSLCPEKPIHNFRIEVGGTTKLVIVDPYNLRLKLVDWSTRDVELIGVGALRSEVSGARNCSKLILYSRDAATTPLVTLGFNHEAKVLAYFKDGSDANLYAYYFNAARARLNPREGAHEALRSAKEKVEVVPPPVDSRRATPADAVALSAFLSPAFRDYPTPIDAGHLHDLIKKEQSLFRIVVSDGKIVATASAEINHRDSNAEISDCATHSQFRGMGLVTGLIRQLERDVSTEYGVRDYYSLARAGEVGMNCAFAKCGYSFTGRLINNCRMPNGWESINVWCRSYAD